MDANGTRYHLLLGEADWTACGELLPPDDPAATPRPVEADLSPIAERGAAYWDRSTHELTLRPRLGLIPPTPGERRYTPEDRRGADRDRFGNWYWIDPTGTEVLVFSEGSRDTAHFWASDDEPGCKPPVRAGTFAADCGPPPAKPPRLRLSGLAVTAHHYLVVGTLDPGGLLVFDLHGGGPPRHLLWPAGQAFAPFDMAASASGGLWILDRPAASPTAARLWELDARFRVRSVLCSPLASPLGVAVPEVGGFASVDGSAGGACHPEPTPPVTVYRLDAADPVAVEGLCDGSVLVLDRQAADGFAAVWHYPRGEALGRSASTSTVTAILEADARPGFRLVGHDFAVVPRSSPGGKDTVFVVTDEGNQAFAFALTLGDNGPSLDPRRDYLPLRRFGGKALVATGARAYYDFRDGWVPLVAQPRPRFVPGAVVVTPLAGQFGTRPAFDGREPDCVWHRLMLDARIPPECEVRVWSRAANDPAILADLPWQPEPKPYRRGDGSELPFVDPAEGDDRGTYELLFQRAKGRYLQVKLRLTGNGRATPRLRALRAYYPRFSYLHRYLPAVYREDPDSASFLDRFLANPEGIATAVEDRVAAAQLLFDPRTVPADLLDWLAGWLAVTLDPTWGEHRRRLFLGHAVDFLRFRGTLRGVQTAVRLAIESDPDESIFTHPFGCGGRQHPVRIVERFRTRNAPAVAAGDPTEGGLPAGSNMGGRWRPEQGAAALHERYRLAREAANTAKTANPATPFPLTLPDDGTDLWRRFARTVLGFVPESPFAARADWETFLARRYGDVSGLNRAWHADYASFADVPLAGRLGEPLPPSGPALADWFAFEAVVLAMRRTAHRFTVLIPVPGIGRSPDEARRRAELARRVINLEKPAHTAFDVRFYYAFFRAGEARLGFDTVLDHGSRAADLLPPLVLGRNHLAEAVLAARHPQDVTGRPVVGRDRLARSPTGGRPR